MRHLVLFIALLLPLMLTHEASDTYIPNEDLPPLNIVIAAPEKTPKYNRLEDLVYASLGSAPQTPGAQENCLAQVVYFEARSENLDGQLAVAQVVLNRVMDHRYPDDICAVAFQNEHLPFRCQFSFACDGRSDRPHNMQAWAIARTIAHIAMTQKWKDVTQASTHYHAVDVRPYWQDRLDRQVQVGHHIFYRDKSF